MIDGPQKYVPARIPLRVISNSEEVQPVSPQVGNPLTKMQQEEFERLFLLGNSGSLHNSRGINLNLGPRPETIGELLRGFEVVYPTVDNIEQGVKNADIVFIGENHRDVVNEQNGIELVRYLSGEGDVVLKEGEPAEKPVADHRYGDQVKTFGWDDIELKDKAAKNFKRLCELEIELRKTPTNMDEVNRFVRLKDEFSKLYGPTIEMAIVQRNKSLIKTIEQIQLQHSGKKIFIITGDLHFQDQALIDFLNSNDRKYIMLKQVASGADYCTAHEYIGVEDPELPQEKRKRVFLVEGICGRRVELGESWFANVDNAKVGDLLILHPECNNDMCRLLLKKHGFQDDEQQFKLIEIF